MGIWVDGLKVCPGAPMCGLGVWGVELFGLRVRLYPTSPIFCSFCGSGFRIYSDLSPKAINPKELIKP